MTYAELPTLAATESHAIYRDAWFMFVESAARGEILERNGVSIATAGGIWPVMNVAFLSAPVTGEADLRNRIAAAKRYLDQEERHWLFILFDQWIPNTIRTETIFWDSGLCFVQRCTGMQVERLDRPSGPLPQLVCREAHDRRTRLEFCDINAESYGFPPEWTHDVAAWMSHWPAATVQLHIGYLGQKAVSCALVQRVGDVALLGWVATRPEHQRKRYGEVVVRSALSRAMEDWNVRKVVLHSTPSGLPLYRGLGWSETAHFSIYLAGMRSSCDGARFIHAYSDPA